MLAFSPALFAQEKQSTVILSEQSPWRAFYTLKTPVMTKGDGGYEELKDKYDTPLPPDAWRELDFDDRTWHHSRSNSRRGGFFPGKKPSVHYTGNSTTLALHCLRGKFKVKDPSQVKGLTLSANFWGGIVVYLNGKEVARKHLSDTSEKNMLAIADNYSVEAFLNEKGDPLKVSCYDAKLLQKIRERQQKHNRKIENLAIPSSSLRKGVNVLAIEVHRSAYPSEYIKAILKSKSVTRELWSTCNLARVRLSAVSAQGLEPNVLRPQGFQVWNSDLLHPDGVLDYGNPTEPLKPVTIIGTINGTFSGKVMVGSTDSIKGLKATISDLKQIDGKGRIPVSRMEIRYGLQVSTRGIYPLTTGHFDTLSDEAPDEIPVFKLGYYQSRYYEINPTPAAVVPIWLTIKVPADARPGDYKGELVVSADGQEDVKVPVDLKVCAFRMPAPQDFHTFTELIPSPDSVAMHYKVPLWSDKHFKLMENTFKWLGEIGNRTVYLPLIAQTNMGNEQTVVRWIKKTGGGYTYDFTIMDKYLDLIEKHQGKPEIVVLYVWDVFLEKVGKFADYEKFGPGSAAKQKALQGYGPQVSLLDQETGKVTYEKLPKYSNKEASLKIWRPLIASLRENLKKRGLEKAMMLGIVTDITPTKELISYFNELFPGMPWVRHAHSFRKDVYGQPYGYQALVWSPQFVKWPDMTSLGGWGNKDLIIHFQRYRNLTSTLGQRLLCEMNIAGKQRGFGRFGADFWPVLEGKKGKKVSIARPNPKSLLNGNPESKIHDSKPSPTTKSAIKQPSLTT